MKKRILFCLLALMLCLSLCACGNDGGGSSSDSNSSSDDNDGGSSGDNSQAFVCEGAVTPDASWDVMQYFSGEWVWACTLPCKIDSITIREDGTCLLGDVECPFAFCKNSTEDCIVFHVREDENTIYSFEVKASSIKELEGEAGLDMDAPHCDNFDLVVTDLGFYLRK